MKFVTKGKTAPERIERVFITEEDDGVYIETSTTVIAKLNNNGTLSLFDGVEDDAFKTDSAGRIKVVKE